MGQIAIGNGKRDKFHVCCSMEKACVYI